MYRFVHLIFGGSSNFVIIIYCNKHIYYF